MQQEHVNAQAMAKTAEADSNSPAFRIPANHIWRVVYEVVSAEGDVVYQEESLVVGGFPVRAL